MTLPTLPPCTVPDCPAPIVHWHGSDGYVFACHATLNGKPCPHGDPACYAPRETAPLHLPDVDTVARAISLNGSFWERIAAGDFLTGDGNISIDSRTIPAPSLNPWAVRIARPSFQNSRPIDMAIRTKPMSMPNTACPRRANQEVLVTSVT